MLTVSLLVTGISSAPHTSFILIKRSFIFSTPQWTSHAIDYKLELHFFNWSKPVFLVSDNHVAYMDSPKKENDVIIYSPSGCSKPVCIFFFFCWTQKNIFWRMWVIKQWMDPIDFHGTFFPYYNQWGPSIVWLPILHEG